VVSGEGCWGGRWAVGRRWLKRAGQSVGGIGDATTSEWWCGGYWRRDMARVRVGAGAGAGVWPLLKREGMEEGRVDFSGGAEEAQRREGRQQPAAGSQPAANRTRQTNQTGQPTIVALTCQASSHARHFSLGVLTSAHLPLPTAHCPLPTTATHANQTHPRPSLVSLACAATARAACNSNIQHGMRSASAPGRPFAGVWRAA
jgi:hypothetical protein